MEWEVSWISLHILILNLHLFDFEENWTINITCICPQIFVIGGITLVWYKLLIHFGSVIIICIFIITRSSEDQSYQECNEQNLQFLINRISVDIKATFKVTSYKHHMHVILCKPYVHIIVKDAYLVQCPKLGKFLTGHGKNF